MSDIFTFKGDPERERFLAASLAVADPAVARTLPNGRIKAAIQHLQSLLVEQPPLVNIDERATADRAAMQTVKKII